ncbi:MAG: hypothetical protein L0L09_10280 [Staphylococcus equorum]|uniref:hypothetical protein n=1 Tax=Staphylococcus TaxID=1279 RepID=UPI002553C1CE|nr:hypothetical protein [Staphylococcus equorum]MDK9870636.1 hypothetical protein [Staphylococcus equorum]MDK9876034.1 hypothetical protein [Staphylococcus equorum]MDN6570498.1 hypothetical protein [Staphylococcus equorum]MDN6611928.1 hypothetical protein [Staphylococcus equorum]
MNLKQVLKITLLIVILAEEIKSVGKNKNYRLNIDTDELVEKLSKKRKVDIY